MGLIGFARSAGITKSKAFSVDLGCQEPARKTVMCTEFPQKKEIRITRNAGITV